ncbi:MAG: histidine kinase [Hoeflea sp.]|nr:histidine kinase [Hoeflea sp.]|tara:strand:+ start:1463 stop:4075 length:2613 start_codon:yes stop_codon:yes gene_type:complete
MDNTSAPGGAVDLSNCDREPIHLLGRVQEFGFLVAATSDWMISDISENAGDFIDRDPESLLGEHISAVLASEVVHTLRNRLQNLHAGNLPDVVSNMPIVASRSGETFDISVHISGSKIILEFEPHFDLKEAGRTIADVQQAIQRISRMDNIGQILKFSTRFVAALTDFDRVMGYVFRPDGSGDVQAETHSPGMEPFLGLRYPATDIPAQARALYIRNPVRSIGNTANIGSDLLPRPTRAEDYLDLSNAVLRSVSPIHLEYLQNMGVNASLSISLIVDGKLWGLLACHHNEPKHLPQVFRNSLVLFGQMLSMLISGRLAAEDKEYQASANELINSFSRSAAMSGEVAQTLIDRADLAMQLMSADGMAVASHGQLAVHGRTPREEDVLAIVRRLNTMPPGRVFATNELGAVSPEFSNFADNAAGMLTIPISKSPRDYIMFFRGEVLKKVKWAGNPEKPATLGPNGIRLTPRKSFEAWQSIVEGQSEEWTQSEIAAAEQFRITVLEVVLRMAEETAAERRKASEKQELLIAELNHRVRNILGLVRSLIAQTSKKAVSAADFAAELESRVQSLARAHDQITRHNWSAASLRGLLSTEAEAYLLDKADRIEVKGDDIFLVPAAYSTVALVLHEMMTNSAKYGALSDSSGIVNVDVNAQQDGSVDLVWREFGGPPVKAPTRRGFGTTIIERSIPFELSGSAEVDYAPAGVSARFWLPGTHVRTEGMTAESQSSTSASRLEQPATANGVTAANGEADWFPKSILLVEDNLIIAMDTEKVLFDLGAEAVATCAHENEAFAEIKKAKPDFAILDINLGSHTSVNIARKLEELGVPFVFASGYGDAKPLEGMPEDVYVLSKPYDKDGLEKAVYAASKSGA